MVFELGEQGITRAEQEFGVTVKRADVLLPVETVIDEAAAAETDLLILDNNASFEIGDRAGLFVPPTHYAIPPVEVAIDRPNVTTLEVAFEQSGFLAGVAAASTTRGGVIGYVGAWEGGPGEPSSVFQSFRAGYEAGAKWVDPDVQVLSGIIFDFSREFDQYFKSPRCRADRSDRVRHGRRCRVPCDRALGGGVSSKPPRTARRPSDTSGRSGSTPISGRGERAERCTS